MNFQTATIKKKPNLFVKGQIKSRPEGQKNLRLQSLASLVPVSGVSFSDPLVLTLFNISPTELLFFCVTLGKKDLAIPWGISLEIN